MNRQFIYQIERLTKRHGQKEVLKDIWLAFYPGAKIGVLGSNGAEKVPCFESWQVSTRTLTESHG